MKKTYENQIISRVLLFKPMPNGFDIDLELIRPRIFGPDPESENFRIRIFYFLRYPGMVFKILKTWEFFMRNLTIKISSLLKVY